MASRTAGNAPSPSEAGKAIAKDFGNKALVAIPINIGTVKAHYVTKSSLDPSYYDNLGNILIPKNWDAQAQKAVYQPQSHKPIRAIKFGTLGESSESGFLSDDKEIPDGWSKSGKSGEKDFAISGPNSVVYYVKINGLKIAIRVITSNKKGARLEQLASTFGLEKATLADYNELVWFADFPLPGKIVWEDGLTYPYDEGKYDDLVKSKKALKMSPPRYTKEDFHKLFKVTPKRTE